MSLYLAHILAAAKDGSREGVLADSTFTYREVNAGCGDEVTVYVLLMDGKIVDLRFVSTGCVISRAASALTASTLIGKTIDEVLALQATDVIRWLGVTVNPFRERCATLTLVALQRGLTLWQKDL